MYWKVILGLVLFAMIFRGVRLRLRYFLAFFIYAVVVMFGSVVYTIKFALKGKPRYENSWEFTEVYRLARSLIGLQPRIYGLETYDPEKQCVYITNHQSFIDVLSLLDIWNQRCTVIAKNSLKYFGPLGAILYYTKTILIHRSDHKKAIDEMNRTAELIVKDEVNLFMFPEGTRNASGRLLPFKKGAFYLAIQTQLPIQPIVVSCYNSFLDHKKCTFSPVPFGVYILPAIPTTGMEVSQVNELVDQAYASMSEIYERTVKASREELGNDLRKKSE
uniref:1-acyl-sn-glycerol-3-phosphate acyltransferase n=1 Tax=Mesocestoides corti TaxID=53468 RepID=A0A5K3ERC4_MESCO